MSYGSKFQLLQGKLVQINKQTRERTARLTVEIPLITSHHCSPIRSTLLSRVLAKHYDLTAFDDNVNAAHVILERKSIVNPKKKKAEENSLSKHF